MKHLNQNTLHLIEPTILLEILCNWKDYKPAFLVHIILDLQARTYYTPPIGDHVTLLKNIAAICKSHCVANVYDLIQLYTEVDTITMNITNGLYDASIQQKKLVDEFGLCWEIDL